jgi:hypothetical protein
VFYSTNIVADRFLTVRPASNLFIFQFNQEEEEEADLCVELFDDKLKLDVCIILCGVAIVERLTGDIFFSFCS